MKVIVMGAGISGIIANIRFPHLVSNLEIVTYEKNSEIGGTWFENRYPGVACGMNYALTLAIYLLANICMKIYQRTLIS